MGDLDAKKWGIISADIQNLDLPNTDLWSYMRPFLEKYKKLTALVSSQTDKTYTYEDVISASLRWAKELEKHFQEDGTPPTVACMLRNDIEYFFVFLGCAAAGAAICPIRHDYDPNLVSFMLREVTASILVIESTELSTYDDVIKSFGSALTLYVRSPGQAPPRGVDLMDVFFPKKPLSIPWLTKSPDVNSILLITFTSGTTGKPKGILVTQKSIVNHGFAFVHPSIFCVRPAEERGQDIVLSTLPLAHSYGLQYVTLGIFTRGGIAIICDPFKFNNMLSVMEKYKPHVLKLNPYVIEELNKMVGKMMSAFERVRYIVNVGSQPNRFTFEELKRKTGHDMDFQDLYGTSETGVSLATPVNDYRPGATGKLPPDVRLRFEDVETGEPVLEAKRPGELIIQTLWGMKEYLNNPDATSAAYDENGFFRTGDVGYYDEDKFVYIIDRRKDLIWVDGKKVFPSSIERVLKSHEGVKDAGVIESVDLATGSEAPKAFVIRRSSSVTEEALMEYVRGKAPREMWLQGGVVFVNHLPRNHLGKLERKQLRTLSWLKDNAT